MSAPPKPGLVAGHAVPAELLQHIKQASGKTGVDFSFLVAQASLESGFETQATSRRSSAQGLFQFTRQTWLAMFREHGASYGYADLAKRIEPQAGGRLAVADKAAEKRILDLRRDPALSAYLAAELAKRNARQLEHALGRKPSAADLRLSLLLGASGAIRFLRARETEATASAAAVVPQAAKQNPSIFYGDGHTPKSVAAVYRRIEQQLAAPLRQVAALGAPPAVGPPAKPAQVAALGEVALKPGGGLATALPVRKS